jgi:acyl carrier protein
MTREKIRETLKAVLGRLVPELDFDALAPDASLREQLAADSMDFLNFAIGLHKAFGVEIPEADYRQLATLDGCVAYLAARIKAA